MEQPKTKTKVKIKQKRPIWVRRPLLFILMLCALLLVSVILSAVYFYQQQTAEDVIDYKTGKGLVSLPKDDGPHDVMTEWWYYSGHLQTNQGRRFSYHYTIFAHRALADHSLIHATLLDHKTNKTYHYEDRLPGVYTLETAAGGFQINKGDWLMRLEHGRDRLVATAPDFSFDLDLSDSHGVVLQDGDGLVDFKEAGQSYYYSRPRMLTGGKVVVNNETLQVKGQSWFDHQWGEFRAGVLDWEWFAIQLDDGADIMLFQLRNHHGNKVYMGGTYSHNGEHRQLLEYDFILEPTEYWQSKKTQVDYPVRWKVKVPSLNVDLKVTAIKYESEFDARKSSYSLYWEGPMKISGSHAGKGFLEVSKSSSATNNEK